MSKNKQKNLSEINLGNQTFDRGYADGLAGRPKSIKKTHRHAHRYHAGHRLGASTLEKSPWAFPGVPYAEQDGVVLMAHGEGAKQISLWQRLKAFLGRDYGKE